MSGNLEIVLLCASEIVLVVICMRLFARIAHVMPRIFVWVPMFTAIVATPFLQISIAAGTEINDRKAPVVIAAILVESLVSLAVILLLVPRKSKQ